MAENTSIKRKLRSRSRSPDELEPKRLRDKLEQEADVKRDTTANINDLPNELLEMILSELEIKQRIRNERVCKRWHWQGNHEQTRWPTELIINIVRFSLLERAVNSLLSRCGKDLIKLEIVSVHDEKTRLGSENFEEVVEAIVNHCPILRELTLVQLPLNSMKKLSDICTKLKVVCLHNLEVDFGNMLSEFISRCEELEVLDIKGNIDKACFAGISKKLQILRLSHCYLYQSFIDCLWKRVEKIAELSCTCLNYELWYFQIENFWEKYMPTLRKLHIDSMCSILFTGRGQCFKNSLHVLQNLEVLSFAKTSDPGINYALNLMVPKCIALEVLCLRQACVSDCGLSVLNYATRLRVLDISCNKRITSAVINILGVLPVLEKLNIGYLPNVGWQSFLTLACSCSNLKLLDVSGNRQVANGVVHVLNSRLRTGDLKGNFTFLVGESSVTTDVERCEKLKLDFCTTTPFFEKPLRDVKHVVNL